MEFPDLGEHCSEKTCKRLDFLPMRCDACQEIFCKDHITYANHKCTSSYRKDVQVPVCPLCNTPIPIKRGEMPDIKVGEHIDRDCKSDPAQRKRKIFTNKCSKGGCKQKEMIRVTCDQCHLNYCLKHRHPLDHDCKTDGKSLSKSGHAAVMRSQGASSSSASSSRSSASGNPRPVSNGVTVNNRAHSSGRRSRLCKERWRCLWLIRGRLFSRPSALRSRRIWLSLRLSLPAKKNTDANNRDNREGRPNNPPAAFLRVGAAFTLQAEQIVLLGNVLLRCQKPRISDCFMKNYSQNLLQSCRLPHISTCTFSSGHFYQLVVLVNILYANHDESIILPPYRY
uniref:Zinc finger, AN1-type domain 2A n=1 Tax=Fundulus heteroclitus TaxID=8078 RepID=A0A3Q2QQU9_FUNHE